MPTSSAETTCTYSSLLTGPLGAAELAAILDVDGTSLTFSWINDVHEMSLARVAAIGESIQPCDVCLRPVIPRDSNVCSSCARAHGVCTHAHACPTLSRHGHRLRREGAVAGYAGGYTEIVRALTPLTPQRKTMNPIISLEERDGREHYAHGLFMAPDGLDASAAKAAARTIVRGAMDSFEEWSYDDIHAALEAAGFKQLEYSVVWEHDC